MIGKVWQWFGGSGVGEVSLVLGWGGGRRRLYEVLEAASEGPGRQASRWAEEVLACCRFALVVACIAASACTLALEVHRWALVEHRKAF